MLLQQQNVQHVMRHHRTATLLNRDGLELVVIDGEWFLPHARGGGLVSLDAMVTSEVFVAETAMVRG